MRYYLIFEHTGDPKTKRTRPTYIVEQEWVAEDFCKNHPEFYYGVRDDGKLGVCTTNSVATLDLVGDVNPLSKGLYEDIKCPYCGANHFTLGGTLSTAVHIPTIIKDGEVQHTGAKNHSKTECRCLNCGNTFYFDENEKVTGE